LVKNLLVGNPTFPLKRPKKGGTDRSAWNKHHKEQEKTSMLKKKPQLGEEIIKNKKELPLFHEK